MWENVELLTLCDTERSSSTNASASSVLRFYERNRSLSPETESRTECSISSEEVTMRLFLWFLGESSTSFLPRFHADEFIMMALHSCEHHAGSNIWQESSLLLHTSQNPRSPGCQQLFISNSVHCRILLLAKKIHPNYFPCVNQWFFLVLYIHLALPLEEASAYGTECMGYLFT